MMADGRSVGMDIPLSRRLKTPSDSKMDLALQKRLGGEEPLGQSRWKEFHSRTYEASFKVTTTVTSSRTKVSKSNDSQEFHVNLDVRNFRPDELSIMMVDNRVIIEGKHEGKQNGQRQFRRTYDLPSGIDTDKIKSSLSDDGILEIYAPKLALQKPADRIIPIARTGVKKENDLGVRQKVQENDLGVRHKVQGLR